MSLTAKARGRVRAWSWVGLPAIVLTAVLIGSSGMPVIVARATNLVFTYELPMLMSIIAGCAIVLRVTGIEHRFWGLLSGALICLFSAEVIWTWHAFFVSIEGLPLNHPYRLLHVATGLLFITVIVTMTKFGEYGSADRARVYLDILGTGVLAFPAVYVYLVLPLFEGSASSDALSLAMAAIYPVIGGMLVFAAIAVSAGWKSHRWRLWERLVAAAMAICGFALALSPFWNVQPAAVETAGQALWYPTALGAAIYLIFVGAVYRLTSTSGEELADRWPSPLKRYPMLWSVGPVVMVAGVALLAAGSISVSDPLIANMLLWTSVILAAIVGLRSWVAAVEKANSIAEGITDPLTGALDAHELERDLREQVLQASHHGMELCVAVIGVGGFDLVERRHGQESADVLLAELAAVLRLSLPIHASVYRWLDGTFVLLLPDMTGDEAVEHLNLVRLRARRDLLDADRRRVDVHAGMAIFPEHGLEPPILLSRAQRAELESEAGEGGPVTVWSEELAALEPQGLADAARMRSLRRTVRTLAEAVDARDAATRNHSANVAELATALAQVLYLPDHQTQLIGMAALLHDVGKIGISDEILLKPSLLSEEEREIVRNHAELGARILGPARMDDILPMVRSHHEHWDGTGYPDGLAGHDIPLESRILAVCDAFESMTTGRPYAVARTAAHALAEIEACAGTQFDPAVAAAFARMVRAMGVGLEPSDGVTVPVTGSVELR